MKVVLDESLGIPKRILEEQNVFIRKTNLKKSPSLEAAIGEGRKGFFNQSLKLLKTNMEIEMDTFLESAAQNQSIFYFYDPNVTNGNFLRKISNWNFPDRKLYLVDGANNRAFTLFLLKELQTRSFDEVYQLAGMYDAQKFTITNDLKYQIPSHYLNVKERKQKQYYLLKGNKQTKITKGERLSLIEKVLETIPVKKGVMTSRSGIQLEQQQVEFYQLEENSLPMSSEKIDIFIPHNLRVTE